MAIQYTYDDFLNKYNGSNVYFSDADLKLAQQNPNAGMGILDAKIKYGQATTAAERSKYNQQAENIRSLYGGYTAGREGSGYTPTISPNDFEASEKPTFSYNPETDLVYQAYQKQYSREGDRATQNALASASAATGGIPSSYATVAATQAGDYYASQISDKIPELYNDAYNRYLNELSQWNTDRSFAYNQQIDEMNQQTANRQEALQKALYAAQFGDYSQLGNLGVDITNLPEDYEKRYNEAVLAAQYGDYSKIEDLLGIKVDKDWMNQNFNYNLGMLAGQYGDYDTLKKLLGITANSNVINNTDTQNLEMMYNLAIAKAEAGDYSYLNKLLSKYF